MGLIDRLQINSVSVIMSSADIKVLKTNRFAKAITLFFWHVPQSTEQNYSVHFNPVKVCGNSNQTELSLGGFRKNLAEFLFGVTFERVAMLKGIDEIGRPISLSITF